MTGTNALSITSTVFWVTTIGSPVVSILGALVVVFLNHRADNRREKERAEREDRLEKERADRLSRERLDDLRRVECVRLMSSSSLAAALTSADKLAVEFLGKRLAARFDVRDASEALQLFGPATLAEAATHLSDVTLRYKNETTGELNVVEYLAAVAELKQAAKAWFKYPL